MCPYVILIQLSSIYIKMFGFKWADVVWWCMYGLCFRWPGGCASQAVHQTHHGAVLQQPAWLFSGVRCEYGLCSWNMWECVSVLCTCTGVPSSTEAQMAMGKGLIKEKSLIKITPLAGGIYTGMQERLSLVHAQSKHLQDQNPVQTFKSKNWVS